MANNVQIGHYKTFSVTIDGKDFTSIIADTDIYQDIYTPTWSGTLTVIDAVNAQVVNNIAVGSKVSIKVTTDAPLPCKGVSSKTFDFILHAITDKVLIKKGVYGYIIKLIPEEALLDVSTRISKSYKNKSPQAIVSSILSDSGLGSLEDKSSDSNVYDVIIPNWSPFVATNWVCKFAKTSKAGADWVFFQSDIGKFKFKSIEDMFSDSTGYKFIHGEMNYRTESHKENDDSFIKIQKYQFISQLEGYKNMVMGFFGNSSIAHDIINKQFITTEYKYSQDIPLDNNNKPFKSDKFDSPNSSIMFTTLHGGMTSSSISPQENAKEWLGSRRSHQMKSDTNRLVIEVAGSACIWETVGKTVNIELPSQEDVTKDKLDKYYKGDYLVTAIRHHISGKEYMNIIELSKKRLASKIKG